MSLQKKCFTASAITHGLLVLLVFVGSAFIPQKPQIKGPEFEIFTLPPDFELVAQDNVFSGGSPDAKGGPRIATPLPQQPVAPPPQPKVEPKAEVPAIKPVQPKAEPEKKQDPPKAKADPKEDFDFTKARVIKSQPKKKEPTEFQDLSKARTMKIPVDSKNSKQPDSSARETQLAAARASELAKIRESLQGKLSSSGGPSGGRGDVDDILGPGGARVASYSLYLAGIYRDAWVAPTKSSARKVVRVKVTISRDGTVLSREVLDKSGDRDFARAAELTVNRVRKFDRPPPTNEPSVTYTLEFIPPE